MKDCVRGDLLPEFFQRHGDLASRWFVRSDKPAIVFFNKNGHGPSSICPHSDGLTRTQTKDLFSADHRPDSDYRKQLICSQDRFMTCEKQT